MPHVLEKFLAWAVLHEKVHVLVVFKEMMQLDDVGALELSVHFNLLPDASG